MAGRSQTHRARLAQLGIEHFCNLVTRGELVSPELKRLGIPHGVFYKWVVEPENAQQWASAKSASAHALSERAVAIAMEETDPRAAGLAKLKHDALKWFATVRNPAEYGDRKNVHHSGHVTVGALHLTAVRTSPFAELPAPQPAPIEDAEYIEVAAEPELDMVAGTPLLPEPEPSIEGEGVPSRAGEQTGLSTAVQQPSKPAVENASTPAPVTSGWGKRGRPRKSK